MTKIRILSTIFMVFALFAFISCDDDTPEIPTGEVAANGTIMDAIERGTSYSALEAALVKASGDLPTVLNGAGPFTVFAPSNAAFNALAVSLGFSNATALVAAADPGVLAQILTYHVVAGSNEASSLSDGAALTTVQGDALTVVIGAGGAVQLVDATKLPQTNPVATVTLADAMYDNGIIHFIDKVLLPQAAIDALDVDIRPSIADWATGTDDLSTLVAAITKAGLLETVVALDSATVLAPTNQAFSDLLDLLGDDYTDIDDFDNEVELTLLSDILTYHVIPARVASTDLMPGEVGTVLGDSLTVISQGGGFVFGDATAVDAGIVAADIDASNGFVHIIDKVLLPQSALDFIALLGTPDLATIVVDTPAISVLEEALIATDLVGAFADATNMEDAEATNFTYFRPATVFAPTDAAFIALLGVLGDDYTSIASFDTEDELKLLSDILLYHVVAGKVTSEDLEAGSVTTVGGSDITIIAPIGSTGFVIGDATDDVNANIVIADVLARNGVAHVIDKVLLPQVAIDFIQTLNEEEED